MQSVRDAMQAQQQEEPELVIADARYQTIADICETTIDNSHSEPNKLTAAMDRIVLNRWLGVPVFLFVMYLMFVLAINIGGALQPLFEGGSEAIFINGTQWLGMTLGFPDWLTIFLAQGSAAVSTPCCRWCRRSG